jgi:hypothetical protein
MNRFNLNHQVEIKPIKTATCPAQYILWIAIILLTASGVSGCAQIRKVTYPPNYVYLEHKEVTNTMVLLNLYIRQIDAILSRPEYINGQEQIRVVELLTLIGDKADSLNPGSEGSNHLVFEEHLNDFKSDVYAATFAARKNPPNYYLAGEIFGSCVACHKFREY